jgi:integrase
METWTVPTAPRTPSYRHHKPSGQAVVTIAGRDVYLGRHGTPESRAEYDRLVAEWLLQGRPQVARPCAAGGDVTVNELVLAYLKWADTYYVKGGKPTSEVRNIRLALRPVRHLYGDTLARDFGPLALKVARQAMIDSGICRTEVNKRVRHVIRCFKWAVSEELVPPSVHHGLQSVSGLRQGRVDVRESEPVWPVHDAHVDAIRPHVSRQVWAMVELQRLTGARPGEVVIMRTCDLDMGGPVWAYTPARHKTEHHGRQRQIYLGPRAQAIVQEWLRTDLTTPLFSPAEAERAATRRAARKTKVQPSQQARGRGRRATPLGDAYTTDSYCKSIARAIKAVNKVRASRGEAPVPHWHPHMLRHSAATRLRREFGLDTTRAVLGHSSPSVTEVYAELDMTKAAEAMERVG